MVDADACTPGSSGTWPPGCRGSWPVRARGVRQHLTGSLTFVPSWAMLGSNQRPPRCQRGALPLRQSPSRRRRESNPRTGLCRPLPKPLGHSASANVPCWGKHGFGHPKYRAGQGPAGRNPAPPSGRRDSNPRPSPWQGDALPTEPRPHAGALPSGRVSPGRRAFRTVADPGPRANSGSAARRPATGNSGTRGPPPGTGNSGAAARRLARRADRYSARRALATLSRAAR